ncbi:MAG: hypothetical protein AB2L14_08510 [Candidatus Xenobiia bacterium LiM19]
MKNTDATIIEGFSPGNASRQNAWSPDGGSIVMAGLNASLTEWMLDWELK